MGLSGLLRGWGQMRANPNGWPMFNKRLMNYPRFKKEWEAYRQVYHARMSNDLAAKTLRKKCVSRDAVKMISPLEDLDEMWETLDTCHERPEKYMAEALKPILDFRRHRVYNNCAVKEFYSLLRAAIKGAMAVGHFGLLE
jgi:hypothetical protein